MKSLRTLITIALSLAATVALAVGPAPAPMKQKEVLSVGFIKVGHLAPMLMLEDEQLGKPGNFENAFKQLKKMQGKAMVFHTALCLFNSHSGRAQLRDIPTALHLRALTDAQIESYLLKEQPYDCAGSARAEGLGIALIARYDTTDPNALIGLPLIALTEMLANEGVDPLL